MTIGGLKNLIYEGENSHVEFKAEAISNEELAIIIITFLNGQGGTILFGVNDDGAVSSLNKDKPEEWAMNIYTHEIHPRVIPY